MTEALYRERSEGPIARTHGTLPRKTKKGLIGQIENAFKKDMLAEKFPAHCKDGSTICGTDEGTAIRIIEAHVSGFEWPPRVALSTSIGPMVTVCSGPMSTRRPA